jgi:pimeloyl-ACP methyl ester carboxylesterase
VILFRSEAGAREIRARYENLLGEWPVASVRHRVPTRAGETFVLAFGKEDGPPLLLFHGSGANAMMWRFDAPLWAERFRCYAVDMIGEPGLSAPSRPPLGSEAYALWLDDVLAGLVLERAAIVGVSLGGWLALDYATRRPGRVTKLALLCPGGLGRQKNFLLRALPLLLLGAWGRRRVRDKVLGKMPEGMPPEARAVVDLSTLIFKHFRPRTGKLPVFSDRALQSLSMPVLAIVGGRDVLLDSRDTQRRLARNLPRAEVRFLPDAGHLLRGQAGVVLDFLSF